MKNKNKEEKLEYTSVDLDWDTHDIKHHYNDIESFYIDNPSYNNVNAYGLINPAIKNLSLSLHNVLLKLEKRLDIPNAKKSGNFSDRLLNVQIDSDTNKMLEVQVWVNDKSQAERTKIRNNVSYFIENARPTFSDNLLYITFNSPTASKKIVAEVASFISFMGAYDYKL